MKFRIGERNFLLLPEKRHEIIVQTLMQKKKNILISDKIEGSERSLIL